jgi:hypothetical protein
LENASFAAMLKQFLAGCPDPHVGSALRFSYHSGNFAEGQRP